MPRTLGIMLTWTTYGPWLRGDARGWVDKGVVFPPNPQLRAADQKRLRLGPFTFAPGEVFAAGGLIGQALRELDATIHALHVGTWHVHGIVRYLPVPMPAIVKKATDRVRRGLGYRRAIWVAGYDKRFCFDAVSLRNRIEYVRRHNVEDRMPPDPWPFIVPLEG